METVRIVVLWFVMVGFCFIGCRGAEKGEDPKIVTSRETIKKLIENVPQEKKEELQESLNILMSYKDDGNVTTTIDAFGSDKFAKFSLEYVTPDLVRRIEGKNPDEIIVLAKAVKKKADELASKVDDAINSNFEMQTQEIK